MNNTPLRLANGLLWAEDPTAGMTNHVVPEPGQFLELGYRQGSRTVTDQSPVGRCGNDGVNNRFTISEALLCAAEFAKRDLDNSTPTATSLAEDRLPCEVEFDGFFQGNFDGSILAYGAGDPRMLDEQPNWFEHTDRIEREVSRLADFSGVPFDRWRQTIDCNYRPESSSCNFLTDRINGAADLGLIVGRADASRAGIGQPHVDQSPFDRSHVDQSPFDRSHVDQSPFDRSHVDQSPFDRSHVDQSPFDRSHVDQSPFERSHVDQSPFDRSHVDQSPFERSHVDQSPFERSHVDQSPFDRSHVDQSPFERSHVDQSPFERSHVDQSPFERSHVDQSPFDRSHVDQSPFERSHVDQSPFDRSHVDQSPFERSHVDQSPFERSHVDQSPFDRSHVDQSPFDRSHVDQSPFERSHVDQSPFDRSHVDQSPFERSHVDQSPFERSHVDQSPFDRSHVDQSPFDRSHVDQSPFERSHVDQSPFERSHVDQSPFERSHGVRSSLVGDWSLNQTYSVDGSSYDSDRDETSQIRPQNSRDSHIFQNGRTAKQQESHSKEGSRKAVIPPVGSRKRKQRQPRKCLPFDDPTFRGATVLIKTMKCKGDYRLEMSAYYSGGIGDKRRKRKQPRIPMSPSSDSQSENDLQLTEDLPRRCPIIYGKQCASCGTRKTPLWRDAEDGTPLCNACGIRYKKYRTRCLHCWMIPRKETKPTGRCAKCGTMIKAQWQTQKSKLW